MQHIWTDYNYGDWLFIYFLITNIYGAQMTPDAQKAKESQPIRENLIYMNKKIPCGEQTLEAK